MDTPARVETPRDCGIMMGKKSDNLCCVHKLQFTASA